MSSFKNVTLGLKSQGQSSDSTPDNTLEKVVVWVTVILLFVKGWKHDTYQGAEHHMS